VQERRSVAPLIGAVALGVVVLDQLAKRLALDHLDGGRVIQLVGPLRLDLVFNQGLAFGLGSRYTSLIALAAAVVVLVLLRNRHRAVGLVQTAALGLIVGGAAGNLLDRLFRAGRGGFLGGAVIDFVDARWWPVFNVADSAITIGAVLLAYTAWREPAGADGAESVGAPPAPGRPPGVGRGG
jgi:signal peptidase II